jgi:hypothetical protein
MPITESLRARLVSNSSKDAPIRSGSLITGLEATGCSRPVDAERKRIVNGL